MKKIELFDIDKLPEYEAINKEFEEVKTKYKAHKYGAYMFDYPFIINHIAIPNNRIIDFGCGFGALDFYLADKGCEVWAVDRDDTRWFMEKHPNIHFVHAAIPEEMRIEDGEWDYVIAASSIEHNEPAKIKQIFTYGMRLLRPGGTFIATMVALKEAKWEMGAYCLDVSTIKEIFDIDAAEEFNKFDELFAKFGTKFAYPFLSIGIVVQK